MYRKVKKFFAICVMASMIFTQIIFSNVSYAETTSLAQKARIYGSGRVQTAIEISKTGWSGTSDYAVLATAYNFPDALCAAPLAKKYSAPLLLTEGNALSPAVKDELLRLHVKNVIIVGGPGVVSDAVFNGVKEIANVQRVYGNDREETSVEVAKKLGTVTEAVLATGLDFPDALSISSLAAAKGMPILLTSKDSLNVNVDKYIKDNGIRSTYIVGGTGVIGSSVEAMVPGPVRLAGQSRIQTNYEILSKFASEFDFSKVYLATALDFPDALAGSALAAMTSSPIVLTDGYISADTKNLIKSKLTSKDSKIIALGGTAVISDSVADNAISDVSNNTNVSGTVGVQSVNPISLNQIKIVYTKEVDKSSAENSSNYEFDGAALTSSDNIALQSDSKTVIITLDNNVAQQAKKLFIIKEKSIYSQDNVSTIPRFSMQLNFFDVTAPVVNSITTSGNKTLIVEFNEAVKIPYDLTYDIGTTFLLDNQYLVNYGFNSARAVNPTPANAYSNKLELSFNTDIPLGQHTLTIPAGTSSWLVDPAGFKFAETYTSFTVSAVVSPPRVVSVTGQTNGVVYVTYDRATSSS